MSSVGWMAPAAFYKEFHVTMGGTVPVHTVGHGTPAEHSSGHLQTCAPDC